LGSLSGLPESEQVAKVHDFLTFNAMYTSDADHYAKSDYWATPTELIGSGGGDCEDFALARYASLRQIGIPPERLQIAYVKRDEEAHMVLLYRDETGGEPWVLDNLEMEMLRTPARQDLAPVFSFNERQAWTTATLGDTSTPAGSPTQIGAFQGWLKRVSNGE
jgi:predicted transglutaminase-like cysteine proteinase